MRGIKPSRTDVDARYEQELRNLKTPALARFRADVVRHETSMLLFLMANPKFILSLLGDPDAKRDEREARAAFLALAAEINRRIPVPP